MKRKGVTLIELVAAIAISAIIYVAIYSVYLNSQKVYNYYLSQVMMQNSARVILDEFINNINNAQVATPVSVISNQVTENGTIYKTPDSANCTWLLYVVPSAAAANNSPFVYTIKNNSLYKIYKDGSGWNNPITSNINTTTSIDTPIPNALRIRLNLINRGNSKAYTTFVSVGGGS